MKKLAVFLVLGVVACGPRIDDKNKSWSPDNSSDNNTSQNNTTSGTNSTNPNNVTDPDPANNVTDPDPTNNVTDPDPTNNVTDPDPTNNNPDPDPTNNTTMPTEVERKCAQACELLWGNCVDTRCSLSADVNRQLQELEKGCKGTGGNPAELCTARYPVESEYRSLVNEIVADGTCNSERLRDARCFTFGTDVCQGCPTPNLDAPCATDSQCDGGLLGGICNYEDVDGSNPDGQCLAGGCNFGDNAEGSFVVGGTTGCGDGACYVLDATNSACFPRCNTNNDCRSGYSCLAVGALTSADGTKEFLGICQTACSETIACPDGFVCGTTRACEPTCTSNADCGGDFVCTGTATDGTKYCKYAG